MIAAAFTAAVLLMQAAPSNAPLGDLAGTRSVSPVTVTPKPGESVDIAKRELVCQDQPVLGTLFPKRVCITREEMNDQRRQSQDYVRQSQALRPYDISKFVPNGS